MLPTVAWACVATEEGGGFEVTAADGDVRYEDAPSAS